MTDEIKKMKLEELGYDEFINLKWKALELADTSVARVIAEHKQTYKVKNCDGEYSAKITGKQMFDAETRADYPAVGDWVAITIIDKEQAVIQNILPRKTILQKKYSNKQDTQIIATNIDVAFIVESLDRDYNLNRLERYLVLANEGGIKPAILLNKIDLVSEIELNLRVQQLKNRFGCNDIFLTSAFTEQGLKELGDYIIKGGTYCFIGSSGVGKSSLINRLLQQNEIKTDEISDYTGRGRHSTTTRQMYFLENGGIVIDNPGTREVGVVDAGIGIENIFDEIQSLAKECKFSDCTHTHEPKCAVLKAIEDKKLDWEKYQNYIKLKDENKYYEMNDLERRRKDRRFGQFIKKAKGQLKGKKGKFQ